MPKNSTTSPVLCGYRPGDLGLVICLHGDYYHRHRGFDLISEAQEAAELAEFLTRLDPARDIFLTAWLGEQFAGAVAIDGASRRKARACAGSSSTRRVRAGAWARPSSPARWSFAAPPAITGSFSGPLPGSTPPGRSMNAPASCSPRSAWWSSGTVKEQRFDLEVDPC